MATREGRRDAAPWWEMSAVTAELPASPTIRRAGTFVPACTAMRGAITREGTFMQNWARDVLAAKAWMAWREKRRRGGPRERMTSLHMAHRTGLAGRSMLKATDLTREEFLQLVSLGGQFRRRKRLRFRAASREVVYEMTTSRDVAEPQG